METKHHQLHIFFLPLMAQGHMKPAVDMAKLVASRGLKATIITTPFHANTDLLPKKTLQDSNINVLTLKFPDTELPQGWESNLMVVISHLLPSASTTIGPEIDQLIERHRPDCLVADMFFPWATDVAARHGVPRLVFHGTSCFSLCATLCLRRYLPHKKVSSDSEPFLVPNLPGDIKLTRDQLPHVFTKDDDSEFSKFSKEIDHQVERTYGVLVNSFYELEPVYADHYKKGLGSKSWQIGPLFLHSKLAADDDHRDKANRAIIEPSMIVGEQGYCLEWLRTKKPNSVVYVCFGSLSHFNDAQLMEIALALEASGQEFIWVVKRAKQDDQGVQEEWLPEGFEKRTEGKGLIVRGWAPQVQILQHEAVGGFVTHCGWNSTLEAACAGVPMVTWPIAAEQFFNEKLVTQVLGIGVGVGAQKWDFISGDFVKKEAIEKAVSRVMEGDEAQEMRRTAKALGEMARKAVEEGGSSCLDLNAFIEELKMLRIDANTAT